MRNGVWVAVLLGCLWAPPAFATASYANRALGLDVSALGFGNIALLDYAIPISIQASLYLDNSFMLIAQGSLTFFHQRSNVVLDTVTLRTGPGTILGGGGYLGARYLFLEENIRPYVDLVIAGIGISPDASGSSRGYVGPGVGLGVDFFVGESVSFGPRGFTTLFLWLNQPPAIAFGGGLNVVTYF